MASDALGLWGTWLAAGSAAAAGLVARFSPRGRGSTPPPPGEFLAALFERFLNTGESISSSSALESALQYAAHAARADHLAVAAIVPGTREWRVLAASGPEEPGEPLVFSDADPLVIEILKGERVLILSGAAEAFPGVGLSRKQRIEALAALPWFEDAHRIGGLVAAISEHPWTAPQQTLDVLTGLSTAISIWWERAQGREQKTEGDSLWPSAPLRVPPETLSLRPTAPEGTETILLVEDDPAVRDLTHRFLKLKGFKVLSAADGIQALEMARHHPELIQLLITDLVMPEVLGPEVARKFRDLRPESKVLFMSGYGSENQAGCPETPPGSWFIAKPFTLQTLAQKVRQVIDAPSSPPGPPEFPPRTNLRLKR